MWKKIKGKAIRELTGHLLFLRFSELEGYNGFSEIVSVLMILVQLCNALYT